MTVQGVDLYEKFNKVTSWSSVDVAVGFCLLKLCNGASRASTPADAYVAGCKSVGIPVGGYLYALGGATPSSQGLALAGEARRLDALGVAPALDYEDASLPTSASGARSWITSFFTALKSAMPELQVALLYASGGLMNTISPATLSVPGLTILVWDAEYGPNDGGQHVRTHYTADVAIHQYTSTGAVAGITGGVDRNALYDNRALNPLGAPVSDPLSTPETRTDPDYTGATALTGQTTLAGITQRFDNAMQQIEGMERALQTSINSLAAAVGADHTAEAAQLAGLLTAIQSQTATVSDDQITALAAAINTTLSADTVQLLGQKLLGGTS